MPARRSKRRQDVKLTNQRKVFVPKVGFTKGDVVDYYRAVAAYILPHLRNRPVSLLRFPDGVEGKSFYAKNAPSFTPDWVARHEVPRRHSKEKIEYILINDVATLMWCGDRAASVFAPGGQS
jgi:bifunctional non-homologous end joining protein LigD